MEQENTQDLLFSPASSVRSQRILYTPSPFAKANLLYLQETGTLTAQAPHTSRREGLNSCLCFTVLKGRGSLEYEGASYELTQGDVVFLHCLKPYAHTTGAASEDLWTLQWCHFYGASAAAIYAKYQERGGEPVIHPDNSDPYIQVFQELYQLAASGDYIRDMRINETLSRLLTLLMSESWHPERQIEIGARRWNIQQVKTYLDENYAQRITLESAAEHFFISKHYLARLFKKQYGVTLTAYLQQVRITHAKQLLRFSGKKVEEIGLECGIGDLAYFSRLFKKIEGVSPTEYRNLW